MPEIPPRPTNVEVTVIIKVNSYDQELTTVSSTMKKGLHFFSNDGMRPAIGEVIHQVDSLALDQTMARFSREGLI